MNSSLDVDRIKALLNGYKISSHGLSVLNQTVFWPLVAPTSVGRNTVIKLLVESGEFYFIRSDTTRPPRVNNGLLEQNGREYWFKSVGQFIAGLEKGEYIEAALIHNQQLSGISVRELKRALSEKKLVVTDLETVGARNLHKLKTQLQAIYLLPPSFHEWMARLNKRGLMSLDEQRRRLISAVDELNEAATHDFYQFVVNDELEQAAARIKQIVVSGHNEPFAQKKGRDLALLLRAQLIGELEPKKAG
jgi:guanylate kinase